MRYLLIIISLILPSCAPNTQKDKNVIHNIDIYQDDMTYEKYKQYVIEFAEKATFPNLTDK
tara:strand:+ start:40 stop:222 length:183 start_codon:yes stop_codon:yes gene_type:complete